MNSQNIKALIIALPAPLSRAPCSLGGELSVSEVRWIAAQEEPAAVQSRFKWAKRQAQRNIDLCRHAVEQWDSYEAKKAEIYHALND